MELLLLALIPLFFVRRKTLSGPQPASQGISFASGSAPMWPLVTANPRGLEVPFTARSGEVLGKRSRSFGSARDGGARRHAGVDLFGNAGDTVVAMAPGRIVRAYPFFHGSWALVIQHDGGPATLYGEVGRNTWRKFDLKVGDRVIRGQPIAKLVRMSGGSTMLHLETYRPGTTTNSQWKKEPPPSLMDPTKYLVAAARRPHPAMEQIA